MRTVIEKKETEEKESEENAEKRKRQKKENEGARKVEKCEGHLDVKKLKAPHLQSNLGGWDAEKNVRDRATKHMSKSKK